MSHHGKPSHMKYYKFDVSKTPDELREQMKHYIHSHPFGYDVYYVKQIKRAIRISELTEEIKQAIEDRDKEAYDKKLEELNKLYEKDKSLSKKVSETRIGIIDPRTGRPKFDYYKKDLEGKAFWVNMLVYAAIAYVVWELI